MLFRAERGESMRGWREAAITIAAVLLWLGPAAAKDARPEIAYLVVDAASGPVLAAQNATQPPYSASVTKAMTAFLVFEALDGGPRAAELGRASCRVRVWEYGSTS